MLMCSASSIKASLISVLHFLNRAEFLNATVLLLSAHSTVTFPVTKTYVSE